MIYRLRLENAFSNRNRYIKIHKDPHLISDRIEELDDLVGEDNWDIFFTDQDTKGQNGQYIPCFSFAWRPFFQGNLNRFSIRKIMRPHFKRIGARYGSYSYIIRRSGIEKILNFLKEKGLFLPYDMEYTLPEGISFYGSTEDIVSTLPNAPSDNTKPNYEKRERR